MLSLAKHFKTSLLLWTFVALMPLYQVQGWIDLNSINKDFILETKQIAIPEYPCAFNPSVIRWKGNLLLAFRIHDPLTRSTNQFGITWLDEEFNPIGKVYLLETRNKSPYLPPREQDPRLFVLHDELYVAYNNIIGPIEFEMRRMFIAKIQFDNDSFFVDNPEALIMYEGENFKRIEKNWVPFVWQEKLMISYSINPHLVFKPLFGKNQCALMAKTSIEATWEWGQLRGGTPGFLVDGEYLAFFHSYKDMPTVQSKGKKISHYFMGAYTFEANPPFALTKMSPEPIVDTSFYAPPYYDEVNWKPLRVIFPGGFVFNHQYVWVVYGRQDHEMWVVKLDKQALLDTLVPVRNLNPK